MSQFQKTALHCQLIQKLQISGSQPLLHTGFWEALKNTDAQVSHDSISLEGDLGIEIFFKAS